jgi:hypothetical protein
MKLAACLAMLAIGCGSETAEPAAAIDSGPADVADTMAADTIGTDTMTSADAGPAVSLSGTVTRKAGTKPTAGGKGHIYVALFDGNPITDMMGAKLVGRALIENVDMNPESAAIPYKIEGIPPSGTERQVVAFLDDNKTATTANPAPDKGDLVTIEIATFSGVKVKVAADTKLDLQLNAAIP